MSLRADSHFVAGNEKSFVRRWLTPVTMSFILVGIATAVMWLIETDLQQGHLVFIYLVPTVLIALRYGSVFAIAVTLISSVGAAYFVYAPRFSFAIANPLDVIELILFGLLALLASQVLSGFAKDGRMVRRRQASSGGRRRGDWREVFRRLTRPIL